MLINLIIGIAAVGVVAWNIYRFAKPSKKKAGGCSGCSGCSQAGECSHSKTSQ